MGAHARVVAFAAVVSAASCLLASPAQAAHPDHGFARIHARLLSLAAPKPAGRRLGQPLPHAQAGPRPHRRRLRLTPLQRAFHFGHGTGHGTAPTTQATSSGTPGLNESPLTQASPSKRDLILPSSERIRFDERAGRRASRAPPVITTSAFS